jgi:hypothetical protein
MIGEVEAVAKDSIDKRNVSVLRRCLYSYQSLFYSITIPDHPVKSRSHELVVEPILMSFVYIFEYATEEQQQSNNTLSLTEDDLWFIVAEESYSLGIGVRNGNLKNPSNEDIESLFADYI